LHDIEVNDEGVAADVNDEAKDDMAAMYDARKIAEWLNTGEMKMLLSAYLQLCC